MREVIAVLVIFLAIGVALLETGTIVIGQPTVQVDTVIVDSAQLRRGEFIVAPSDSTELTGPSWGSCNISLHRPSTYCTMSGEIPESWIGDTITINFNPLESFPSDKVAWFVHEWTLFEDTTAIGARAEFVRQGPRSVTLHWTRAGILPGLQAEVRVRYWRSATRPEPEAGG